MNNTTKLPVTRINELNNNNSNKANCVVFSPEFFFIFQIRFHHFIICTVITDKFSDKKEPKHYSVFGKYYLYNSIFTGQLPCDRASNACSTLKCYSSV